MFIGNVKKGLHRDNLINFLGCDIKPVINQFYLLFGAQMTIGRLFPQIIRLDTMPVNIIK